MGDAKLARRPSSGFEASIWDKAGEDLLADHDSFPGFPERARTVDGFMVGENNRGEAQLLAATAHLKGRHSAIKRSRAMEVEVNPDNGGACTYRHVGYYKRTEEGRGLISGVAVGW